MALTRDGGASAHHAVLLWPWPHCLIALMAARWRIFTAAVLLGVVLSAGVVARHYTLLDNYGADPPWSSAIYALTDRIGRERPQGVFVTDWGINEQILLATRGQLPLEIAFHRHLPPEHFAARPGWIFAGHVDSRQAVQGANATWKQAPGFRRISIAVIPDRQGFPIFELFRYSPDADAPDRSGPRP
jgi:hypothetical protein